MIRSMFPYDSKLVAAVETVPRTVADVVGILEKIQAICGDNDGLKWFNGLYLEVTQAVEARVNSGEFAGPGWIAALDVEFAGFYFAALRSSLTGGETPGCWQALFDRRDQAPVARIQFALAGMNAHINHDLPMAVVSTCETTGIAPRHGEPQYDDFTALNTTLDSLIEAAKLALRVRLPGDSIPEVCALDDTLAAWSLSAAREGAWNNAQLLWHLAADAPWIGDGFMDMLDGLTALASKTLLVAVG